MQTLFTFIDLLILRIFSEYGRFHYFLLLVCGFVSTSEEMDVISMSFILPSAQCDLQLNTYSKGWLNSIIFIGKIYRPSQGERRQLSCHPCFPPISVDGFMHPTNQPTAREEVVASLPLRLSRNSST